MTARLLLLGLTVVLLPVGASAQFTTPRPIGDIELPETGRAEAPPIEEPAAEPPIPVAEDESEQEVYIPGRRKPELPLLLDLPAAPAEEATDIGLPSVPTGPTVPDEPAPVAAAEQAKEIPEIELPPADGAAQLEAAWQARREAVARRDFAQIQTAERRLLELKDELGIENLFVHAGAVALEAETLLPDDSAEALRRSLFAAELAPGLPAAHWSIAHAALADDLTNASRYLASAADAVRTSLRDPRWSRPLLADVLLLALIALFIAGALTVVLVFLRHVRYFLHDFKHLFPRGAHVLQTSVLAVLVLALPVIFGLGPFAILFTLAASTWLYMALRERLVVGIFLTVLGVLPLAAELAVRASAFQGTTAELVLRVERGGPDAEATAALRELAEQPSPPFEVLFALGRQARREGRVDEALDLLRSAAERRPDSPQALIELGNAQFLHGDLQGARETYQRASELAPGSSAVWFNLARLYNRKAQIVSREEAGAEISRAQEAVRRAVQIDPKLAHLASSDIDYRANRYLAGASLDGQSLAVLARAEVTGASVGDQIRKRVLGGMPGGIGPVLPALLVGLLALTAFASRSFAPSRPCSKCGRAVCRRCDAEVSGGGLCGQCVYVFTRSGAVDPASRVAKEIGIRRYNRRRESVVKLASLVACGAGHVLSGKPGRGVAFMALFIFFALHFVFAQGLVQVPVGRAPVLLKLGPVALAALLVYLLTVRQTFAQFRASGEQT